eukprot:357961-Chlamydomonas_euryale.AAC.8
MQTQTPCAVAQLPPLHSKSLLLLLRRCTCACAPCCKAHVSRGRNSNLASRSSTPRQGAPAPRSQQQTPRAAPAAAPPRRTRPSAARAARSPAGGPRAARALHSPAHCRCRCHGDRVGVQQCWRVAALEE